MSGSNSTVPPHRSGFDPSILLEVVGDDRDLLAEVVELFGQDVSKIQETLQTALASQDAWGLARSAHALKGILSYFGPTMANELANRLETNGLIRDLDDADQIVAELGREIERIQSALAEL